MKAYETAATVEREGKLQIAGVPFAPGTQVDVMVRLRRKSAEEFAVAWREVCQELRTVTGATDISEAQIQREIDDHRAGR